MEKLFIKEIKIKKPVTFAEAEHLLEQHSVTHTIGNLNWKEFSYKPEVRFRIAHISNEIWLKYYVKEKYVKAIETRTNGDVYKDTCVEFFIAPTGKNYYNFEISCIGTIHLAYGEGRNGRKFVDPDMIAKIERVSTLGNQPFEEKSGNFDWEIMIRIPVEVLTYSKIKSLSGLKGTANFYKCGDETSIPHYVTWNPVKTKEPDYHRPEFFGQIQFE